MTYRAWGLFINPPISPQGKCVTPDSIKADFRSEGIEDVEVRCFSTVTSFISAFTSALVKNELPNQIIFGGNAGDDALLEEGDFDIRKFLCQHRVRILSEQHQAAEGFMTSDLHFFYLDPKSKGGALRTILIVLLLLLLILYFAYY